MNVGQGQICRLEMSGTWAWTFVCHGFEFLGPRERGLKKQETEKSKAFAHQNTMANVGQLPNVQPLGA